MRYRKLGSSDLEVSEISLGSWLTYAGGVEAEQTRACTDAAFEAGINFFDTANVYGRGAAEAAWGEILSGRPRDSYILATKVWGQMSDDPSDRGLSAEQIAKQIDASLRRLQTDYVDLYQAHRFDPDVPIEETIEALQQVIADGKARYLGFSEWTRGADPGRDRHRRLRPVRLLAAPVLDALAGARGGALPALRGERDLADRLVAARPGRADRASTGPAQPPPADSRAASESMSFAMARDERRVLEAVERLRPVAEGAGLTLAELALAWVLRRAGGRLGDRRRVTARAGPRQRRGVGIELSPTTLDGDRRGARGRRRQGADARAVRARRRHAPQLKIFWWPS